MHSFRPQILVKLLIVSLLNLVCYPKDEERLLSAVQLLHLIICLDMSCKCSQNGHSQSSGNFAFPVSTFRTDEGISLGPKNKCLQITSFCAPLRCLFLYYIFCFIL